MKILFASDIHGSAHYCAKLIQAIGREAPCQTVLLGDLLYHGPRNPIPQGYDPMAVAGMLNALSGAVVAVRGNCDAEIDQMVLEFPIMGDYALVFAGDTRVFATHGHVFSEDALPKLAKGDYLVHGHTHVRARAQREDYTYLNPGSVSIPKGDGIRGYMVLRDGVFTFKDLDGTVLRV